MVSSNFYPSFSIKNLNLWSSRKEWKEKLDIFFGGCTCTGLFLLQFLDLFMEEDKSYSVLDFIEFPINI